MIIGKNAKVTLDLATPNTDLSAYVISATVDTPSTVIDDRTFGDPYASDIAAGNQSVTLALRWSPALAALLKGQENKALTLTITPDDSQEGTPDKLTCECEFAYDPFPEMRIGEETEVDLVLAVIDEITFTPQVIE